MLLVDTSAFASLAADAGELGAVPALQVGLDETAAARRLAISAAGFDICTR
jgi:hypothetical protein